MFSRRPYLLSALVPFLIILSGCVTLEQKRLDEAAERISSLSEENCSTLKESGTFHAWAQCYREIVTGEMPESYRAFTVLEEHLINITELSLTADQQGLSNAEFNLSLDRERLRFRRQERQYLELLEEQRRKNWQNFANQMKVMDGSHVETVCETANGVERCIKPRETFQPANNRLNTTCTVRGNVMNCH